LSKVKKSKVDDLTLKKLLYAKQFYIHGEQHARQPQNPFNRMIALHHFHIAIEIAIKAVFCRLFPDEKVGYKQFNTLVKKIQPQCVWITDSWKEFLERLNDRRNDVQHATEVLASEHMTEYQVHTKDYLDLCFLEEFEVNFDALDLVDGVSDSKLRDVLIWSKELICMGKYKDSVAFSKLVHRMGYEFFQQRTGRLSTLHFDIDQKLIRGMGEDTAGTFQESVSKSFEMIINEIKKMASLLLTSGRTGGLQNYHSLGSVSPEIDLAESGEVIYLKPGIGFIPNANRASDVREYMLNTILSWQEMGLTPKWMIEFEKYYNWAREKMVEIRKEKST